MEICYWFISLINFETVLNTHKSLLETNEQFDAKQKIRYFLDEQSILYTYFHLDMAESLKKEINKKSEKGNQGLYFT